MEQSKPDQKEADYVSQASKIPSTPADEEPTKPMEELSAQRSGQRDRLFKFAIRMSVASLLFLIILVIGQVVLRIIINPEFEIISDTGLQIISVSIFGQIIGVIYVIAKSLWGNYEIEMHNGKK